MTGNLTWTLGVSAAIAYGVWRAWRGWSRRQTTSENDRLVNEASEESFPASDAPSYTPTLGSLAQR
jgi:hypothetical protein